MTFLLTAEELRARGGGKWRRYDPDVLPCFVADMDFSVAPAVQRALARFTELGDYGYGTMTDLEPMFAAFKSWMERRHGWSPDPQLMDATADVVQGIVAAIVAYSGPGEGVIVQTPVYPPFLTCIDHTRRRRVENPLVDSGGRYEVDLDGLREVAPGARLILLCNPHNPTGRVLERSDLEAIGDIARAHGLVVVADEIHADLLYEGANHVPMETVAPDVTITLTSATKGFNIPAVRTAVVHFGTAELKARFDAVLPDHLLGRPSRFGIDATIASWTDAEGWLAEVMAYLDGNRRHVAEWAASAGLAHHMPEATYLAWLDCRRLELSEGTSPYDYFLERARVGLGNGADFGPPGEGFVRLNFATAREILDDILDRMSSVLD